ncbi:hypothetical protein [Spirosoma arcticum]
MKNLSQWASRHAPLAIALITLCEVINGFNGFVLGATWFDTLPVAGLHAGVAVTICLAVGVRLLAHSGGPDFHFRRWCLFGAFLGNFLLFGLLGGLTAPRFQSHDVPVGVWGSRRIESRVDIVRPDTLRPVEGAAAVRKGGRSDNQRGRSTGFALLFVLSLPLMLFTTGLACGILCSGYGFFAAIVFILGLGFLAGGIYFLGRASEREVKRLRDMEPAERRRAGRRFWLAWGLLTGLFTLLLLVGAVSG